MQRLGQQDAMFLYSEKPRAPMHLCSFHFYAPDPNGHRLTFDEFREHVRSRLPLARLLRRKLVRVPLDLDYPYWVEDRDFDLDYHVRHVTLEGDRDWRAVWDLAAALHSIPIDLHRPPWELYLIDGIDHVEGYEPGGFAMLIKIHHCAIDGIAGIELMNALHDLDPEGRPPVVDTWQPEATPDPLTLLAMTAANAAQSPLRAARFLTHSVPMLLRPRPALRAAVGRHGGRSEAAHDTAQPAGHDQSRRRRGRDRPGRGQAGAHRGARGDRQRRAAHRRRRRAAPVPRRDRRTAGRADDGGGPDVDAHRRRRRRGREQDRHDAGVARHGRRRRPPAPRHGAPLDVAVEGAEPGGRGPGDGRRRRTAARRRCSAWRCAPTRCRAPVGSPPRSATSASPTCPGRRPRCTCAATRCSPTTRWGRSTTTPVRST